MKKETMLKTKRLWLKPMTVEELEEKVLQTADPELRQAYGEMLSGCRAAPEALLWNTPWKMISKQTGQMMGDLCFKGAPRKGTVEIGYGLEKEYEGQGYMTEAVGAMLDWAFAQKDVYAVEAETAPDNGASQRILEKHKFTPAGQGAEGPRFRREKPETSWMSVYMCLGLSIGLSLGSANDNMAVGMSLGMGVGVCIGMLMDSQEKKHRQAVLEG